MKKLNHITDVDNVKEIHSNVELDNNIQWIIRMLDAITDDPGAPASIVGYYLGAATGQFCSIFCPLGCDEYP